MIIALHVLALLLGLFALMSGVAFFLAGLLPGPSGPWWKQYGWAAFALAASCLLLSYAFTGDAANYLLG
jgi:uncharacterized membrane protein HdeD (DUF308 family)